jgi:hypothetical protein
MNFNLKNKKDYEKVVTLPKYLLKYEKQDQQGKAAFNERTTSRKKANIVT